MAASPKVSRDLEARGWKGPEWWHFWQGMSKAKKHRHHEHLYVTRLEELTKDFIHVLGRIGQGKRSYLVFVRDLPVEAVPERMACLDVRDPSRIHICHASTDQQERLVVERLVNAIELGASEDAIVDAWWEPQSFVVLSPRFKRLHIPREQLFDAVPSLKRLSPRSLKNFEIHADGAYVHWPQADVHLGWDQLHQMVDAQARLAAINERVEFRQEHGQAIRALRREFGLTQSAIEGLTGRHLRRIEKGEQPLTHKALLALARAHGMVADEYSAALAERM